MSDQDDIAESVKHEAKKLETRISENMQADGPLHSQYSNILERKSEVHFSNRLQNQRGVLRSTSPLNEKAIPHTNNYELLQQKWQRYMAAELNRIQRQLADRNVSPLKRLADQRKYLGKFQDVRSMTPQFKVQQVNA